MAKLSTWQYRPNAVCKVPASGSKNRILHDRVPEPKPPHSTRHMLGKTIIIVERRSNLLCRSRSFRKTWQMIQKDVNIEDSVVFVIVKSSSWALNLSTTGTRSEMESAGSEINTLINLKELPLELLSAFEQLSKKDVTDEATFRIGYFNG